MLLRTKYCISYVDSVLNNFFLIANAMYECMSFNSFKIVIIIQSLHYEVLICNMGVIVAVRKRSSILCHHMLMNSEQLIFQVAITVYKLIMIL